MCSANVQTLCPAQELAAFSSVVGATLLTKVALLELQFNAKQAFLVGIQEGRSKIERVRIGTFYDMYSAAASPCGGHGSQLWVHHDLRFRLEAWVSPSSRIVLVKGCIGSTKTIMLSAHSPTEATTYQEKKSFWCDLTELLSEWIEKQPEAEVIVFIDTNSRVGSIPSFTLGKYAQSKESENGEMFRTFMETCRLVAASTFFCNDWTWRSPRGPV